MIRAFPAEFRRKVRSLAGVYQILKFYPELLTRRNRMFSSFLFHKLGRLALPYALFICGAASFALPRPWNLELTIGQAIVYGLACVDPFVSGKLALKRVTAPLRTFLVLVVAAFYAARFLLPYSQRLWKETRVREVSTTR